MSNLYRFTAPNGRISKGNFYNEQRALQYGLHDNEHGTAMKVEKLCGDPRENEDVWMIWNANINDWTFAVPGFDIIKD